MWPTPGSTAKASCSRRRRHLFHDDLGTKSLSSALTPSTGTVKDFSRRQAWGGVLKTCASGRADRLPFRKI